MELEHHGIRGQKWGVRNGPPYPLGGGDYSGSEKYYKYKKVATKTYKKKHMDSTISASKDTLSTLSYDLDRTKNVDMFYATYKPLDKHQYRAIFNKPIEKDLYDEQGRKVGTGKFLKYSITNSLRKDMKVASEDTAAQVFMDLYKKDRDFYNFVTDTSRMRARILDYKLEGYRSYKGYREADKILKKLQDPKYVPTANELNKVYRLFNDVIPSDGGGDAREAKDVATQRAKFFNELKKEGYGALLDTTDSLYGHFHADAPVIVFDMDQVVPQSVKQTKMTDKAVSTAVMIGRRVLGV